MLIEERYYEDYQIGETRRTMGRTITEADIVFHAGQTGDNYPHHMDAEWCREQPFGQRIAHGTLVFSIGIGMGAGSINPRATSYGYDRLRFVKPVFINDTLTVETTIAAKEDHPRRPEFGFVREKVEIYKQTKELVLICEHVYVVERSSRQLKEKPNKDD